MEIPLSNVDGLWEAVDVSNDAWGYAWYDNNWKEPKEILRRLISTVARGGTYMLNIGPDGKGSIPGDQLVSVIELELSGDIKIDSTLALDPQGVSTFAAEFSEAGSMEKS